ncbi:hypothetical protein PVA44_07080 (plasmid) [Entomospira nematocerorum]|uniref:Uncharacterized protein n=1 Tax=Entomospira nematocerorum TaxID=2719987 RepID=A0A968KTH2_9SPIO|nr:hypothetical protein [Entomospira nematocera]NIZ47670.1 hypothetical protein [Entomospira nematocera]WDI34562.1 hypothetical protein PVA44_07080 [Entomospira nematocera]
MKIRRESCTIADREADRIWLCNDHGEFIELLSYGARIHSIYIKNRAGVGQNLLKSLTNIEDYSCDVHAIGAIQGPYCTTLEMDHPTLFSDSFWKIEGEYVDEQQASIEMSLEYYLDQADTWQKIYVEVSFSAERAMHISYRLRAKDRLLCNPYHQLYWNLSDQQTSSIYQHHLQISSDWILEESEEYIPTGGQKALSILPHYNFGEARQLCQVLPKQEHVSCCMQGVALRAGYWLRTLSIDDVQVDLYHIGSGRRVQIVSTNQMALVAIKERIWCDNHTDAIATKEDQGILLAVLSPPIDEMAQRFPSYSLVEPNKTKVVQVHYFFPLL